MKTLLIKKLTKFAFTLSLASIALVGCKKEEVVAPQQEVAQQSVAEQATRQITDNKMLEDALKGGLEFASGNSEKGLSTQLGALDTRVLINGSLIGHGVTGYQQPYISTQGNLMAPIAELLRRFEYTVSFANNVLTAQRNANNTFGARTITIAVGATTVNFINAQGSTGSLSLPQASVISNSTFFAPARVIAILGGAAIADWDADTKSLQTYYYEVNDTGLYFYGIQQNSVRNEAPGCQKYIPGEPNAFFNPNFPTVIYVHGWQKGGVSARGRESFLLNQPQATPATYENVQNYWKLKNWNVAIFHWVQLADDDATATGIRPFDTEKKIYDANSAGIGMRWKKSNGNFAPTSQNPTVNVTQIFRQEYQKVTAATSQEIRIIGNSLGGNLSMSMLREVAINGGKLPSRVTLMDPYWNLGLSNAVIALPMNFLTPVSSTAYRDTKSVATDAGKRLDAKLVDIEYFRTSAAGIAGYNPQLAAIASYSHFRPDYVGELSVGDITTRHTQPTKQYMWAIAFAPPAVFNSQNQLTNQAGPSPNNRFVRDMMNKNVYFDMPAGDGSRSPGPGDDIYRLVTGKPQ